MENRIFHVSVTEANEVKSNVQHDNTTFLVEIDGTFISNVAEYLSCISELYTFPIPSRGLDGYYDWMRDLDWLEKERYILIIHNYMSFLKDDPSQKKVIMDGFSDIILPWWESEIEQCVVGGKAKPFNIYITDRL